MIKIDFTPSKLGKERLLKLREHSNEKIRKMQEEIKNGKYDHIISKL